MKGLNRAVAAVTVAAAAGFCVPAYSLSLSDIVYQDQVNAAYQQDWQGNLGMDFLVNTPIWVTALGVYDNGSTSNLAGARGTGVQVGIFTLPSGNLVGSSVQFNTNSTVIQIGGDAFQAVTPFSLAPGEYSIVTLNDDNYNQGFYPAPYNQYQILNNLGGAITFIGSSRYDYNNSLQLPSIVDGGPVDRYDAGTFATPLPSAFILMLTGLFGAGFVGYRRKKTALAAV